MEYRQNDWSILGFGCMRFPKKGGSVDMEETERELAYAIAHGVNYFDTAPDYCDEHSEDIFGQAFQTMDRSTFYVSTKCGLWNAADGDEARKVLEKSLTKMGLQKIDFFYVIYFN